LAVPISRTFLEFDDSINILNNFPSRGSRLPKRTWYVGSDCFADKSTKNFSIALSEYTIIL